MGMVLLKTVKEEDPIALVLQGSLMEPQEWTWYDKLSVQQIKCYGVLGHMLLFWQI